jgi:hypothetical protein
MVLAVALVTAAAPFDAALTAAHTPNWHIPLALLMSAAIFVSAPYLARALFP